MTESMVGTRGRPSGVRSARFAAWGTAFLHGRTSLDEATLRIGGCDHGHDVVGLPGTAGPVGLTIALGELRRAQVTGLRLALPVAGDATGLPGPATLTQAAVDAREAVLTNSGAVNFGLVPHIADSHVLWHVHVAGDMPLPAGTLGETERVLIEVLREATEEFVALDLAGGDDTTELRIAQLRAAEYAEAGTLPPGHPPRSARLLALADRVSAIVDIAATCSGAAHSATMQDRRAALLRQLEDAARHARVAAYNAVLEPAR